MKIPYSEAADLKGHKLIYTEVYVKIILPVDNSIDVIFVMKFPVSSQNNILINHLYSCGYDHIYK